VEKGNEAAAGPGTVQQATGQPAAGGAGTATDPGTGTGTGKGTQPTSSTGQPSGGQQADQSGPASGTREPGSHMHDWSDQDLAEHVENYENAARIARERIDAELAGSSNPEELDHLRDTEDRARRQVQLAQQQLHNREMARPSGGESAPPEAPAGPSGEVQHPGGARTGVDEQGRGYQEDAEGNRTERERFDQFRPGGG
jgi:hypothetical protein